VFDRGPRGVKPTAFGQVLLQQGTRLLEDQAHLEREIKLLAGLEIGTLAVSAGPYPLEISVAMAMTRLLAGHPRLKAQVMVASPREVLRDVVAGQVDVGVVDMRGIGGRTRPAVEPLASHNIFLACRTDHPLAGRRRLTASAVFSFPIASTPLAADAHYGIVHHRHRTLSPPALAFIERLRSVESEVPAAEANAPPAAGKGRRSRRKFDLLRRRRVACVLRRKRRPLTCAGRREASAPRRPATAWFKERCAARCRRRRCLRTKSPGSTCTARRPGPSRVRSAGSRTPSVPPCARPSLDRT